MNELNDLLILGCSGTKRETDGVLPAFELYDGPFYLVLRKFLREHEWPQNLSISVLSAKHELFGALKEIGTYDERLTRDAAAAMSPRCARVLRKWQAQGPRAGVFWFTAPLRRSRSCQNQDLCPE